MKIFISYSSFDTKIVKNIAEGLNGYGETKYWAESKEPGIEAWPLIFSWIDTADIVFVLITGQTLSRSMSVGQEIGRARAKGKFIIPIVEPGISTSELGILADLTYIKLDPANPEDALLDAKKAVENRKNTITKENENAFLAIGGIIALLTLLSK